MSGNSDETPKNVPITHQSSIAAKVAPKGFYELLEKELVKQPKISINDTDYIPVMNIIENKTARFIGKKSKSAALYIVKKDLKIINLLLLVLEYLVVQQMHLYTAYYLH